MFTCIHMNAARDLVTGDSRTSPVPKKGKSFLCQNKSERVVTSTCVSCCDPVKVNGSSAYFTSMGFHPVCFFISLKKGTLQAYLKSEKRNLQIID